MKAQCAYCEEEFDVEELDNSTCDDCAELLDDLAELNLEDQLDRLLDIDEGEK